MPNRILPILESHQHPADIVRVLRHLRFRLSGDITMRENILKPTYQRLIHLSVPVLRLSTDNLKKASYHIVYRDPYRTTSCVVFDFLETIEACMSFGLPDEAQKLLETCLPELPNLTSQFWKDWKIFFKFVEALIGVLQKFKDRQLNATASRFIASGLQSATSYFTQSRPIPPRDWSCRTALSHKCNCAICLALRKFLYSPTETIGRFQQITRIRDHLQQTFANPGDFKIETDKTRTPFTLVIQKTNNAHEREMQLWESNAKDMIIQLKNLTSPFLTDVMEGDVLQISGLSEKLQSVGGGAGNTFGSTQVLQHTSSSAMNTVSTGAVAGTKRKADVIDLTGDDPA
jgi:hypothetical protein